MSRFSVAIVAFATLGLVVHAQGAGTAADQAAAHHHPAAGDGLGTVQFDTSCSAAAQPAFTRGITLLHSFEFRDATDAFHNALASDPGCAIAYWGIALAAWGNPFAAGIKAPGQIRQGLEAVRLGQSIGHPTPRERGYIDAVAKLFEQADTTDQATRLRAYRDAMQALAAREPNDTEATIFYALALAITAPPTDKTYAALLQAGDILERLFAAQPNHPGLAHYIIHAYDVPALAPRALDAARRYSEIAPAAPHALHMPSHTFTRVGDWQRSIDANLASAAAAKRVNAVGEELHASDYLAYAYLQTGRDSDARRLLDDLPAMSHRFDPAASGSAAPPSAGYFAIAAIPSRYALEHSDWVAAMALEAQTTPIRFADAIREFARGLGAARSGHTAEAAAAVARLQALQDELAGRSEQYWSGQVSIERQEVAAWLLFAQGRREEALGAMQIAAGLEDATEKNAITPGPLAPAREMLGEMLLELGRDGDALSAFEAALGHEPNRFRSLAGAARAAARSNSASKATEYYTTLVRVCANADQPGRAELQEARQWLQRTAAR